MIFTPTPENPENTPDHLKAALTATIAKVVRESYPTDKYRSRKLDFETLTQLLITMDGGSIAKELLSAGLDVSASAFVQRRKRYEWRHFERILEEFNEMCEDSATFKGYRVFAVDGTSVNLARDPKEETFMINDSAPKGYNQVHVTPLYDVLNKTYHDCCLQPQPKQDEIGALQSMLLFNYTIPRPSIIVGDRGFESYNLFTHLQKVEGMEFLIRVKQEKTAMKLIRDLPMRELDVDVSGEITTRQTREDKEKGRIFIQTHANPDRENTKTVHEYAVNYKMATYLCKRFLRDPNANGDLLLHEIAKFVEPVRPERSDERKIQPKSFREFVYRIPA